MRRLARKRRLFAASLALLAVQAVHGADLPDIVPRIKQSVVGIGTFNKLRNPSAQFFGTGFAVGDGMHVVTNAHVVARELDVASKEIWAVFTPSVGSPAVREARLLASNREHDIALLRITGSALPALALAEAMAREGQALAFTGFPIGLVLGFHPATHRATLAAITPVVRPGDTARQLNPRMIQRIREQSYNVYQLDGTAYPGNSGSPLYDPETGTVVGIINSTFVQGTREAALSRPSGISYAIPSVHIRDLLIQEGISGTR